MERLLTTAEVAQTLGCKPKKVRQLVGTGLLQAENISPRMARPTYRFDRKYVEDFRMKQRVIQDREYRRRRVLTATADRVIEFMK